VPIQEQTATSPYLGTYRDNAPYLSVILLLNWELMQGYLVLVLGNPHSVIAMQEWNRLPIQIGTPFKQPKPGG
jgi:hypothetical protein